MSEEIEIKKINKIQIPEMINDYYIRKLQLEEQMGNELSLIKDKYEEELDEISQTISDFEETFKSYCKSIKKLEKLKVNQDGYQISWRAPSTRKQLGLPAKNVKSKLKSFFKEHDLPIELVEKLDAILITDKTGWETLQVKQVFKKENEDKKRIEFSFVSDD